MMTIFISGSLIFVMHSVMSVDLIGGAKSKNFGQLMIFTHPQISQI